MKKQNMGLWVFVLMVVLGGGCGCACAMGEGEGMIASGIKKNGMFVVWESPNYEGYVSEEKKSSLVSERTTTLTHTTLGSVKTLENGKSLGGQGKKLREQACFKEESDKELISKKTSLKEESGKKELRRSGLIEKKKQQQPIKGTYLNAQSDVKGLSRIRPTVLLEEMNNLSEKLSKEASLHESNGTTENRRATYEMSVYAAVGQFLTVLRIGTPPVDFTAIVDTGSDLVWRQCMPCKQCYPQSPTAFPIFNPALSSTYRNASCSDHLCHEAQLYGGYCAPTCKYNNPYDDPPAFTRGDLAFDTLSISDVSGHPHQAARFAFGCSHESHGPYNFAGSGGIVGFGQGKLSLPSQLGVKKFSYCFPRITQWRISSSDTSLQSQQTQSSPSARISTHLPLPLTPRQSSPPVLPQKSKQPSAPQSPSLHSPSSGSPLLLGEDATLSSDGPRIQSTPILVISDGSSGYYVQLRGISVAGRRLNISSSVFSQGRTIIDSGTTFTTLAPQAFRAVYAAFSALIPHKPAQAASPPRNLSLCYSSLPCPMPSLSFHFTGAHIHLPTNNYFIFIEGLYCLAILESHDALSVYGNVQQQDFHILYDLHTRHISFKPTSCSLHQR